MIVAPEVSLDFMPSFFAKHVGLKYGEAFYFDPQYRASIHQAQSRYLYDILGEFGVGSPEPMPPTNIFIQPIDVIKLTQGATLRCPVDSTLETVGHPWQGLSLSEISKIDERDAAHHSSIDRIIAQYREMTRIYGEIADVFGIRTGLMNIHTPYTTAHQLVGEDIFYQMVDDPPGVQVVFEKIWSIYLAIFRRIAEEMRVPMPERIYMGDCSAGMLSADVYSEVVLPVNRKLASCFRAASYHSCGASSHLLSAFSEIGVLESIELGAGTDLEFAVRTMPGVGMRPLVDPVMMRDADSETVGQQIKNMLVATAQAPSTTLCAWSLDRDTPISNVESMYLVVNSLVTQGEQ